MSVRRAALAFIFVTVVIDVLAFGIIIPVLPKLVEAFEGGDTAAAAETYGIFGTAWGVMQFFSMPVMGALSDRFGRRPVILISCLGLGLDFFLMALAPNLTWLFVGRVISGITASGFSTAFAYIADIAPPEKRAASFGLVGAAFGLGFVLGPALGGVLGQVDARLPFWVAGCLAVTNAAYGFFILPESLAPEKRARFQWRKANPVGSLVLAGVGVCSMIVQGGLVKPVVAKLGERRAILVGLAFGAAGFLVYGLAPTGTLFLAGVPIMALWGFAGPAVQALMTRHVGESEQGQLQGANASLVAIGGIAGPALFSQTFASFIGARASMHMPGAPFVLAATMLVAAGVIAWRATRLSNRTAGLG